MRYSAHYEVAQGEDVSIAAMFAWSGLGRVARHFGFTPAQQLRLFVAMVEELKALAPGPTRKRYQLGLPTGWRTP